MAEIRALEPFADRTDKKIIKMFDSGAFSDILKAYCKKSNAKLQDWWWHHRQGNEWDKMAAWYREGKPDYKIKYGRGCRLCVIIVMGKLNCLVHMITNVKTGPQDR